MQVLLWLASDAVESITHLIQEVFSMKVNHFVRGRILEKASKLDFAFFQSPTFFNQMENAHAQAGYGPGNFMMLLSALLQQALTLFAVLAMVATLHVLAMPSILLVSLPYILTTGYFSKQWFRLFTDRAPELRLLRYLSNLFSTREPVKEMKLFGLYGHLIQRYDMLWKSFCVKIVLGPSSENCFKER